MLSMKLKSIMQRFPKARGGIFEDKQRRQKPAWKQQTTNTWRLRSLRFILKWNRSTQIFCPSLRPASRALSLIKSGDITNKNAPFRDGQNSVKNLRHVSNVVQNIKGEPSNDIIW